MEHSELQTIEIFIDYSDQIRQGWPLNLQAMRTRSSAAVLLLFGLYLVMMWFLPIHWHMGWLGVAVVLAARTWEVRGGLVGAGGALAALVYGMWRMGATDYLLDGGVLAGYFWAWIATLSLGVYVGTLTHQARTLARVNVDLRQAQQRLGALHKIALTLSTTLDANRLIDMILEQLSQLWGYHYASLLFVDDSTGDLVIAAARGYQYGPGHRLPAGRGICGAVAESGRPVCVGDTKSDSRYIPGVEGARSELAVPITLDGQTIGVLNVESLEPNAFGPSDITLLTTVAEQAAAYISNARLHQEAQHLAITDPHTGLYNYRHYQEQVARMVRESQLAGAPFSLIMVDLDHFKRCNDTYGHPTGDAILSQAARVLRESCRQGDLVFRYGGEEFAVILPMADEDAASRVAERIRERIAEHSFTTRTGRQLDFTLTASIGVASYPRHGLTQVDLLIAADKALYTAKNSGRNRVVCGGPAVSQAAPAS